VFEMRDILRKMHEKSATNFTTTLILYIVFFPHTNSIEPKSVNGSKKTEKEQLLNSEKHSKLEINSFINNSLIKSVPHLINSFLKIFLNRSLCIK
jgi:hypothetical protein